MTTEDKLKTAIRVLRNFQGNINAVGTVDETTLDEMLLRQYAFRLRVIQERLNNLLELIDPQPTEPQTKTLSP